MNKKTILITGASAGIGKITALMLLDKGYQVIATARRTEIMSDLKEKDATVLPMDITSEASIQTAISQTIQKFGKIDILINNAGYGSYGSVEEVAPEEVKRQFDVNVLGLGRMCQLVIPYMRKQKSGRIINISSVAGKVYMPFGAWYHSTKHAVEGLSHSLRTELAPFGIKVVLIQPGLIKSEWSSISMNNLMKNSSQGPYEKQANAFAKIIDNQYSGNNPSNPEVVAKAIIKAIECKKPKTRYITGKMGKLMVFARWFLTDKGFDRMLKIEIKRRSK